MGKVIAKTALVKALEKEVRIDRSEASFIYDVVMDIIRKGLMKGNNVLLHGVGTLYMGKTSSMVSNMTGVSIPPHRRIKFRPNVKLARYIRVNTREYPIK